MILKNGQTTVQVQGVILESSQKHRLSKQRRRLGISDVLPISFFCCSLIGVNKRNTQNDTKTVLPAAGIDLFASKVKLKRDVNMICLLNLILV